MRKLILVALLTIAPVFTLGSTPAAAFGCNWFGFGYAPTSYSYAPPPAPTATHRRAATMEHGSTLAGPSIAPV